MRPINSKEKSKKVWQFLLIFLALAIVPVALIFFSYYTVPARINESQEQKLVTYSNFEHSQKLIIQKMAEVDSNINLLAAATVSNPELLSKRIVDGLADLSRMDTSIQMVRLVSNGYTSHYEHVKAMVDAQDKLKKATAELQDVQGKLKTSESEKNMMMMGAAARMPMP